MTASPGPCRATSFWTRLASSAHRLLRPSASAMNFVCHFADAKLCVSTNLKSISEEAAKKRKKKYEGGERSCLFKPIWGRFCLVEQAERMMFTFDNTCFSSLPAPRLLFWHPCKHAILRQYWASTGLVMNHNGMCTVVRCYLISYLVQKYLLTCCDWY